MCACAGKLNDQENYLGSTNTFNIAGVPSSGQMCLNPYDPGTVPECTGAAGTQQNTYLDPRTGNYIPYFPYYVTSGNPAGRGASCTCSFADMADAGDTCRGGTCSVQCTTADEAPGQVQTRPVYAGGATVCSPWAYSYGFYTGVNDIGGSVDYTKELDITLTRIDFNTGSRIGNFIVGEGTIYQQYPEPYNTVTNEPWKAYFTGGDRITKTDGNLQNNEGGRFRLEVTVNLECHVANLCWQKSARATSLPVVPVPYTARNAASLYDYSFSTFRIAAYDPDVEDEVYFFHASNEKYGTHVGHGIPEGSYPNNPTPAEYNGERQKILDDYCSSSPGTAGSGTCAECPPSFQLIEDGIDRGIVVDFCNTYPEWTVAAVGNHTAGPPPRLMIDPYTGVAHWQTGPAPPKFANDTTVGGIGGYEVPDGWDPTAGVFYTAPYVWRGSGNTTYDGWVYDRNTFSYMRYSNYSDCEDSTTEYLGGWCTTDSLQPGFYNLVVDIRSSSHDSCLNGLLCMSLEEILECEETDDFSKVNMLDPIDGPWTPQQTQATALRRSQRGYNSIPLDFLLYLYPVMSMCSQCTENTTALSSYGVVTYKDADGSYGFDNDVNGVKYVHQETGFLGTGRCFICGGSDDMEIPDGNVTCLGGCIDPLVPPVAFCKLNTRPYWINKDYSIPDDPFTPSPSGWDEDDTRPSGDPTKPPAWGEAKDVATINVFKGEIVSFNLTAADDDDCVELWIYDTGLYRGKDLDYCRGAHVTDLDINVVACAVLDPEADGIIDSNTTVVPDCPAGLSSCPEVNMFDMYLGYHEEAFVPNYNGTDRPILGYQGKSVQRTFYWPPLDAWPETWLDTEYDPRPENSTVCFFAFDGYLFSDFRCVRILINSKQQIYWSDRRPGLDYNNRFNVIRDIMGFNTGTFNVPQPDGSTRVETAPLTHANQTRMLVNVGDLVQFDVQAKQASNSAPIDIFISQGVLPEGATFVKSTDSLYTSDPVRYTFAWQPKKGQECTYQICFLASNIRGVDYPKTVGYDDLSASLGPNSPYDARYNPDGYAGPSPYIDERCYSIEVTDTAAHITTGAYIDVSSPATLIEALDGDCGYSAGGWFFAEGNADMALLSIGYETAGAVTSAHQLRWVLDPTSDDVQLGPDDHNTVNRGSDEQYRYLAFYESGAMLAKTASVACNGGWHYFFVTVEADKTVTIYLDGGVLTMAGENTHEFHDPATATATVSAFPADISLPGGFNAAFRLGSDNAGLDFNGWFNDIRAYSRALTAEEVSAQMFATCTNDDSGRDSGECLALEDPEMAAAAKEGLELWLNFNNANNANPAGTPDADGVVHGCTVMDGLPGNAKYSRYLACTTSRDVRDTSNWGGSYEYCNDYTSLVGSSMDYLPDFYSAGTRNASVLPQCGENQCYTLTGPACATSPCTAADFAGQIVCSYQCSDIDNSFHGSLFNYTNTAFFETDDNLIPFVLKNIGVGVQPVGNLEEMDTPYAPYVGEMTMVGVLIEDKSGKPGRSAIATAGTGSATFEYKVSPAFAACPAIPTPNVVHADGGQDIVIRGSNFAESKFLRCNFGGLGSSAAEVVEYDTRGGLMTPTAIRCKAPGSLKATAAPLDVSNDGAASFTDFNIPVYFTEAAAYFDSASLMEVDPSATPWMSDGWSIGMWFNIHEPSAGQSVPMHMLALEWTTAGATVDDYLMLRYNFNSSTATAGELEVASSSDSGVLISTRGIPGKEISIMHGSSGWHYAMITVTPEGLLTLYMDGDMAGEANVTAPGADATLWVGGRFVGNPTPISTALSPENSPFLGYMDELSIFSKVVSVCEMRLWMWGNSTQEHGCPSGKHEEGVSKPEYMPTPSDLLAHFSFGGISYDHGALSPGPFSLQVWNPATLRYDLQATGAGWTSSVTDGVLVDGVLSDGTAQPTFVQYGTSLLVDDNGAQAPTVKYVTVPFLAPSFNAPRRKICGNVKIATGSREEAAISLGYALSDVGNYMYADINFLDNAGVGGYSGLTVPLGEPAPRPNRCEEDHQFLVDSVVPVEGYFLSDTPPTSTCQESGAAVYGFGFAKSPWLMCMQGDDDGELSPTSAQFISEAEVRCSAAPTERPFKYKFAVSNNHVEESEACDKGPEPEVVETPEMLSTKDTALYFDGVSTFAEATSVSNGLSDTGVTFGAWFYPTRPDSAVSAEQEPIVAFTTACGSALPLFDSTVSASSAPPLAMIVGATYSNGQVCLTSDLPYYSKQTVSGLDLPTTWDSSYGLLDTSNSSLCLPAATGQWHYVEIAVNAKEILIDIPSDQPKVSYLATLNVDGVKVGGEEGDGPDSSLRVPALPTSDGSFFIGGLGCPASTTSGSTTATSSDWEAYQNIADYHNRYFQGMIDEVRVYNGVQTELQWLHKAEAHPDLKAYYTFSVTEGDNQRRQTPHCEQFAAGSEPDGCVKGGAYFARSVEEYWSTQPTTIRYEYNNLQRFPQPTGYYPATRGSALQPTVYPDLVTHYRDESTGEDMVGICRTPTVADVTYSGVSKAHQDLLSTAASFPLDYSQATKHPYAQGGSPRFNQFISSDTTLYNYAAGPSAPSVDGYVYQGDTNAGSLDGQAIPDYRRTSPDYRFMEVPWYAATIEDIDEDVTPLDGGREVRVTGYNIAPSAWLACKFRGLKYENQSLSLDEDFARYEGVLSYGGWAPELPDTVRCPFPGTTDPADLPGTLGSDWLKVPSMVSLQLVNPKAVDSEMVVYKEMGLSLGGSVSETVVTEYASENFHGHMTLTCPDDLRFDTVVFASYGRPQHRCNKKYTKQCNGSMEWQHCDWTAWKTTKSCDSDSKKPKGFTAGIISSYCHGKKTCTIQTKDEIFGDPCPNKNKWLSVAIECSDRWKAKDYAIMSDADAQTMSGLLNPDAPELGEYTFSAWVKPGEKIGQQAVASFGCKDCGKMNRAILQWIGVEEKMGMFLYYDDYIQDVIMKDENENTIMLAVDQWYQVTFTVDKENCGVLYLNGHKVATFSTASRPAAPTASPTFTLGMDLDDSLFPKEFFQGMVDEVRIFGKALSEEEVFSISFWTVDMGSELEEDLVAYYKFNNKAEEDQALAHDETPNALHLTLATSVVDEWDPVTLAYDTTGAIADKHVELEMHGAAWFPATTYELEADFETAPLGGGLDSFSIHGVNFVKGASRVYYGGKDVSDFVLDVDTCEISMLVPDADCEGGESSVYVTNTEGCPALSTPETTITQEASVPDLQSGLVCYFPFFGNAMDWSGNGHDADLVDGAELTENRNHMEDQAYSFDGDDVIKVPDCMPVSASGKTIQTVAMWVKYADIAFPECGKCSEYVGFEQEIGFVGCEMQDHAIMTHAWKLIAAVADDDGTKVYVNGEELVSDSGKLPEYLDLLHNVMLNQEIGGDDFVGLIDDVWIYDRPLCEAELKKLYETQTYAIEIDGEGSVKAPVLSDSRLGSPGLKVTFVTSTALTGPGNNSMTSEVVVVLPESNSDLVNRAGSGVLDLHPDVVVPTASPTDGYSMIVEGMVYAPFSNAFTFAVTASDTVYCWLKDDADNILFTITSGQKDTLRTMEREADLAAGEWYSLRCAYTKQQNDNAVTDMGSFGIRWRSEDGQVNGPLTAPYVRTGGASELVVAAWIHPYEVDGRVGVLSLMGDGDDVDEMARFGLSIVNGALSAAFYTGDEGATCDSLYYREVYSFASVVEEDKWQHVAVAYDGRVVSFFVDGFLTDQQAFETFDYIQMNADVELVVGADASADAFEGQVYSVAMYNKVPMGPALGAWIADLWECPIGEPEDNLILNLLMNEGVGMVAKDFSVNPDHPEMRVFGDGMLTPAATWVDATCDTLGADFMSVEYGGLGLSEGLAGQCMVFSIQSYDKCGRRRTSGGDGFTVEVVGPLHLHTEIYELTVGDGIEDMEDGSYLVHFTREMSGYYLIYVKLDGDIVLNEEGLEATKTYVSPFVTSSVTTYMFDEDDMLGLDELQETCAGVPSGYIIQTVDAYQNLRTKPCDTDSFEVSLDGPYSFDAKVKNMEDGTFTVNYNAQAAGPYQMRVTATVAVENGVEEQPVWHHGGRTCAGWDKSELEYCTLSDSPDLALAGEDYPICIQVHECGSLRTFKDSIYASFPDSDDLDLEGPFTMAAWVKPMPEDGEAARQYILSKQSEYSGKGYWLALVKSKSVGVYFLELGVYVGTEDYRIVSELVALPADSWMRVGATYDGQTAQLFAGGKVVKEESWKTQAAMFQRRNAQPLRVGKAFSGHIDNVMLYSAALPEKLMDQSVARCPAVDSDSQENLVAYYRFNEGATRDMAGNLVPENTAWAVKDSSPKDNDGFVGLFSDETGQNKEMTIKCPAGSVISEILFANYGSNKGGYGTYEKDECGATNSMSYIEDKCLGMQTCKVLAAYSVFGNPCKHATKTLAVNAICAPPMSDPATSQWAIGEPAPHWVGTAGPTEMECPFDDLDSLPMHFQALLGNGTCDDWDMSKATAGETEFFLLRLKDMCGYHNRYPQKVDDYIQIVDTSIMLLDAGDAYEPVFKSLSSAELTYPLEFVPPEVDTCSIAQEPEADAMFADFVWGGAHGGFDMYCSRYRDLYLGMYTPTAAHEEATLSLNLGEVDGEVFKTVMVDIMPADINVAASTTCGPTETAPDCDSDMCEDIMAEAGVEAMFEFVAKDEFGNKLRSWDDLADLSLMVEGGQSAIHTVMQGSEEGVYEFYVIFPHEGNFTVTLKAGDDTGCSFMAYVSAAQPHMAVVYNVVPEVRFEHSMVEYDSNLYVFGGVGKDKAYLSETWKLNTGYQTFAQGFAYRRKVEVEGLDDLDSVPDSQMVEVLIPSAAWMEGGKLQADCEDLLFLTEDGERMDFWVEPAGAPYGCGAETTKVWVEVTDGADDFHMYYGNKGFKSYSSPSVFAKDGMGMFEDFEFEGSPLDNGWALDGIEHDTCTPLEPGKMGDASSFFTTEDISLTGERSLAVDAYSKIGGSIKKAGGAGLEKSFILKGFFYDTMCSGFHYLSPDFDVCQPVQNSKSLLPDFKNAMGVYTDAKADEYCYTYPWMKSGADRSVGWHSFTFVGSEDELKLYIDEEHVETRAATELSSVYIAGGMFLDDVSANGAKAYWDSLLVTPNYAGVTAEVEDEEAVFFDEAHQWVQVGMASPPPARQGHSASVVDGSMYIFGGERSAYHYSDVWKYDIEQDSWQFIAPVNSPAELGRHDHSAVVYDDVMYIYGGKSVDVKGDLWAFNLKTRVWKSIPVPTAMAPRHGHGAVVVDDKMYVYGGYVPSTYGDLSDEVWSFEFKDMAWTKVGPRSDNYMENYTAYAEEAMQFPMMMPESRFAFVFLSRESTPSFYILGGAGGASKAEALSDVAGFHAGTKQWNKSWSDVSDLNRFDAAGALLGDMWACVYGGLSEGAPLGSTVCFFVGDTGLSADS